MLYKRRGQRKKIRIKIGMNRFECFCQEKHKKEIVKRCNLKLGDCHWNLKQITQQKRSVFADSIIPVKMI